MLGPEAVVELSRRYAEAKKIPLTTVSSRVFNDGKKIGAIEGGGDIQVRRFNVAIQWFSDHWPENIEWPTDIGRPEPTPLEAAE